ncbi:ion transporter [Bowmanella sp. Y57]|uniref:Ion transporter n=2 Tax=Bowmanella yangjiangensis TaxID=2811230 RepID=A0ABS3CSP9_9ALTE|nr:ion transporter [Bowmanella yangjiangensis]
MLNFSLKRLRESHEGTWLLLDFFMLGLLILNLALILFDSLYATDMVRQSLNQLSPALLDWYQPLHANFILIDLVFVGIFLSEFMLRWLVAIKRKDYLRWYFYPFIHWYDLVGCIPVGGARFLRFLRIFSILYRLQKYKIIDIKDTAPYRFLRFYYQVFVEEVSDRVVIKVLSDAQDDLRQGSPLLDDIINKVLATRRPVLCQWLASILVHSGHTLNHEQSGEVVRQHVQDSVTKAVRDNQQVARLRLVPVLGGSVEKMLENAVSDIVVQSLANLLLDVTPAKIDQLMTHGLGASNLQEQALDQEMLNVVDECLQLLKQHVGKQRWKDAL